MSALHAACQEAGVETVAWLLKQPELLQRQAQAARIGLGGEATRRQAAGRGGHEAKAILAKDDAAWNALRPIMNAKDDAQFTALRDGWRAGIPASQKVDAAAAQKMFSVIAGLGGHELTGGLTELPQGMFWSGY